MSAPVLGRMPDGPGGARASGSPVSTGAGDAASRAVVRILVSPEAAARGVLAGEGGLGFVVDRRGYVLTHDLVLREATSLQVALADGRRVPVERVWRDPLASVAVLKIDGADLPALPLGNSGGLRVGDAAHLLPGPTGGATPPGRATIRATGSATGGNLAIDLPIAAALAGGPLLDARGQVVGIATTGTHVLDEASRGGFAVPIDRAKPMLRQAQAGAAAWRPPGR